MTIQQAGSGLTLAVLSTMFFGPQPANADDAARKVTVVPVPDLGRPVVAVTDADGVIHLLCDSEGGPKYANPSAAA
jgi:hypothetical protein